MLKGLSLYSFKNHLECSFEFGSKNIIIGPNGSGKTNVLDAIYYILNGVGYMGQNNQSLLNYSSESYILSANLGEDFLDKELKITHDSEFNKTSFFYNNSKVTRPKFIASTGRIGIFFSPLEMNIIYLGPNLRRDFLDEVSALDSQVFIKIKNDYAKILKNRNKLLKEIKDGNAKKEDLSYWNFAFIEKATEYYFYRLQFINHLKDNLILVENLLENKYELRLDYITKINESAIKQSIKEYLDKNIDRDIITGHTYIGPHLDDFLFYAKIGKNYHLASECLSRGENKSILIGLKLLEIEFFKKRHSEAIILLLDDIFAELDDNHVDLVLEYANRYQTFITAQNLPNSLLGESKIQVINIK